VTISESGNQARSNLPTRKTLPAAVDTRRTNQTNQYTNYPSRATHLRTSTQRYETEPYGFERLYEKTHIALKSNVLFDAVSAINVELEVPIDKSWSVAGKYIFPW
jgi:hypothetical protein